MKKLLLRIYIKFYRYLHSKDYLLISDNELKAKSLAITVIRDPRSELRICPKTMKKYVLNKSLGIKFIFNDSSIEFFSDFPYPVEFCKRNYDAILRVFIEHAAADRKDLESEFRTSVKLSFDDMYNNIFKSL